MTFFVRCSFASLFLFAAHVSAAEQPAGDVARGQYIVESVAMCERCHSPGGATGQQDPRRKLEGAPILQPVQGWAIYAPRLAGRPPGTDEEFVRLLTTGISRTGASPRLPMPPFRMTKPDAEAVLAYLKSLRR